MALGIAVIAYAMYWRERGLQAAERARSLQLQLTDIYVGWEQLCSARARIHGQGVEHPDADPVLRQMLMEWVFHGGVQHPLVPEQPGLRNAMMVEGQRLRAIRAENQS